jgi:hypothetical protein
VSSVLAATVATVRRSAPVASIRAVLVGVDEYERDDIPSLRGCVNDVALVRGLLKDVFGVANDTIHVLVNARATRARILDRLETAIAGAEPGDVLVFYFSGHGSQIRDRDGDELTDSLDEILCPYDMDWDKETYILDDNLDELFEMLPPGVLLEAFFDCCFWGAGPRALAPETPSLRRDVRYLPPPFDIAARAEGDEEQLAIHRLQLTDTLVERHVAWGASQEGQEAAEDYIDGQPNGVFTYWGCRFIAEHIEQVDRDSYTREQLLEDLRSYLHSLGYAQTPDLAAPTDLRDSAPLLPTPEWASWVELGSTGQRPPAD